MADGNPFALRRMLALRQFPVLCNADLGELALLAENVAEVTLPAGAVVARAGEPLDALHLVLDGEIATTGSSSRTWGARTWGPRETFGALEVLAYRPAAAPAVATTETTTLQLLAPDVTDVLEDSFGVMLATLRGLAARAGLRAPEIRTAIPPGVHTLGLAERLIVLRGLPAFSRAPLEALAALAHAAEDAVLPAGTQLARGGSHGASSIVIVDGEARMAGRAGGVRTLGRGDVIGHLEMLGDLPHEDTVEATAPVRGLVLAAPCLFDVIEDHTDLGRAILAVLAGILLDDPGRVIQGPAVRQPLSGPSSPP